MLFETDVLLAALNPNDPFNQQARKVFEEADLSLSPFSLLELNLLIRAGKLEVVNLDDFARDLDGLLQASSVRIISDRAEYHSVGRRLEDEYNLSFFDSLHAAVSKVRREVLVSFDKAYDRLSTAGVKRLDPREM